MAIDPDALESPAEQRFGSNVAGNARITGSLGAVVFGLLFVEGLTILRVQQLIGWHVFIGMLLVVLAAAKIASTGYRFLRYYTGAPAYVRKGPPPIILRALGPVITVTTIAVLASGIAAVLDPAGADWLVLAHKVSFVLWFGATTLHVLGHALETPALALADWRRSPRAQAPGAAARLSLLGALVVVAVPLAFVSLHWAHRWQLLHGR